jgi:1,4-alpha-glucan branching enzyme
LAKRSAKVNQPKKIAWSLLEKPLNHNLFEHYKKLIALRKQNPALTSDNIDFFHENPEAKVLAYSREHKNGSRVIVVANFSDSAISSYRIPNFPDAELHELFSGAVVETTNQVMVINLPEYEAQIFVKTKKV